VIWVAIVVGDATVVVVVVDVASNRASSRAAIRSSFDAIASRVWRGAQADTVSNKTTARAVLRRVTVGNSRAIDLLIGSDRMRIS
jgi:hypothetical protein